jgi:nicotinate dehydrogenase subunit B
VIVNGHSYPLEGATETLIGWLRDTLGLTGTKPGCGEGECGACTVLVDGQPVLSCQTSVGEVAGQAITTIEGLASDRGLHVAQQALVEERASQCGYCSPAMALRIAALVEHDTDLDDDAVAAALDPNLCRCGCYSRIRRAAYRAAELQLKQADAGPNDSTDEETDSLDPASHPTLLLPRPERPWDLVPPEDREYEAILGPGLVCVWPPAQPVASGASDGGAWLHVSPAGQVRAFSGKVDVGQDNRTAFRILVADELGVDLDAVDVIQGDTDVCPYDAGTFGSRSMPDAGESLRRVAAGARQTLEDMGGLAGLGDGYRLVVLDTEPVLRAPAERRIIGRAGHSAGRVDAVSGGRRFVSDLERPSMAYGAILRPPVVGATMLSVDCSKAAAMAGVTVVQECSLVGVVAEDPMTARQAVASIEAIWADPAPVEGDLVGYLRTHPEEGEGWRRPVDEATGDVEAAFAGAVQSVRATYTAAYIAHVPLETRAALAEWQGDRLTVWTATQVPFGARRQVASDLAVDETNIRVVVPPTGGAFGGKHAGEVATEAAVLARAAGRPVRVHWSRAEELQWGTVRPMAVIDVSAALDQEGELSAWDFLNVNSGSAGLAPPYRTRASRLRYQPARSPLRRGSYRALAATANNFARESAIDELAHERNEDPVDLRLRLLEDALLAEVLEAAAKRFGWVTGASRPATDYATRGTSSAASGGIGTGQGVAIGFEKNGRVATCAEVRVTPDGRVKVSRIVTAYECGTVVNPDTVVSQIEGATIMALGGALVEALPVSEGRLAEPSLTRYALPRFTDLPHIEVELLDRPDSPSAGAGEAPMIAVAPAVANAIFDAIGQRLRDLPLTPGRRLPN